MTMRRIIVATREDAQPGVPSDGPALERGEALRQIDGPRAPIHLTAYRLEADGRVDWAASARCRTLFVRAGEVSMGERCFGPESLIVIEAGAAARAQAGAAGADLLEFRHNRGDEALHGGGVHGVKGDAVATLRHDDFTSAIQADAGCAGCGVWMHSNLIPKEGVTLDLHSHTEDEVIVVMEGEMIAGPRRLGPGTALSVAKDTLYTFSVGKGGLRFINFRPSRPGYIAHGSDEVRDELSIYTAMGLRPAAHEPIHA